MLGESSNAIRTILSLWERSGQEKPLAAISAMMTRIADAEKSRATASITLDINMSQGGVTMSYVTEREKV